jgi:hypothetical protein
MLPAPVLKTEVGRALVTGLQGSLCSLAVVQVVLSRAAPAPWLQFALAERWAAGMRSVLRFFASVPGHAVPEDVVPLDQRFDWGKFVTDIGCHRIAAGLDVSRSKDLIDAPGMLESMWSLTQIDGVSCVIAHLAAPKCLHVSTFLSRDETRLFDQVYDAEMRLIDRAPGVRFDFHARVAPNSEEGASPAAGEYRCLIWGGTNAQRP